MSKLGWIPAAVLVYAASLSGAAAQVPETGSVQLPLIDAAQIAKRVVGSLRPAAGERAVIVYDPTYYPGLVRAIELERSEERRVGKECRYRWKQGSRMKT